MLPYRAAIAGTLLAASAACSPAKAPGPAKASARPADEKPEHNFRFRPPGPAWTRQDPDRIDPEAKLAYARSRPDLSFLVWSVLMPLRLGWCHESRSGRLYLLGFRVVTSVKGGGAYEGTTARRLKPSRSAAPQAGGIPASPFFLEWLRTPRRIMAIVVLVR